MRARSGVRSPSTPKSQTGITKQSQTLALAAFGDPRDLGVDDLGRREASATAGGLPALEPVQYLQGLPAFSRQQDLPGEQVPLYRVEAKGGIALGRSWPRAVRGVAAVGIGLPLAPNYFPPATRNAAAIQILLGASPDPSGSY